MQIMQMQKCRSDWSRRLHLLPIITCDDKGKTGISRSTVIFTFNETAKVIGAVFLFHLLVPLAADATVGQILPSRHAITVHNVVSEGL